MTNEEDMEEDWVPVPPQHLAVCQRIFALAAVLYRTQVELFWQRDDDKADVTAWNTDLASWIDSENISGFLSEYETMTGGVSTEAKLLI